MAATAEQAVTFKPTKSDSKKAQAVKKIVAAYRKSETPLVFSEVCAKVGAKFPQDVEAAMFAHEEVGQVKRLDTKAGSGRAQVAFEWQR